MKNNLYQKYLQSLNEEEIVTLECFGLSEQIKSLFSELEESNFENLEAVSKIKKQITELIETVDTQNIKCEAQVRYRQSPIPCTVENATQEGSKVVFGSEVRAISPGQAIVFYSGEIMLGGAFIDRVLD